MTHDEIPFEMSELFRHTRDALTPTPDDLARVHKRVRVALVGGAAAGVLAITKTSAAASGSGIGIAAVMAATLAGGGALMWRMHTPGSGDRLPPPAASRAYAPALAEHERHEPARDVPAPLVDVAEPTPAPKPMPARPRPASRTTSPSMRQEPRDPAPIAEVTAADSLEGELAIVRSADNALHADDPARALSLVRSAHLVQLAAELAAIEIDALCALDRRDEARERVAAFTARWPRSALRDRVTRSCVGGGVK